jgi:ssDNA-binding Zn-finger/Zn-ribbon topoisomerase 1
LFSAYSNINTGINDLENVINRTSNVEECDRLVCLLAEKRTKFEKLLKYRDTLKDVGSEVLNVSRTLDKTRAVAELEESIKNSGEKSDKLKSLLLASGKLLSYKKDIGRAEEYLLKCSRVPELEKTYQELAVKYELLKNIEGMKEQYGTVNNYIEEGRKYLEKSGEDINRMSRDFVQRLRKAGKCPLCSNIIRNDDIERILKHYEEVHE